MAKFDSFNNLVSLTFGARILDMEEVIQFLIMRNRYNLHANVGCCSYFEWLIGRQ